MLVIWPYRASGVWAGPRGFGYNDSSMNKENASSIGTIIAALLASSCCIGPAIFVVFGTSAGFLSKLGFMSALRPYMLGAAFLMLGYSFWKLYLVKPDCVCAENIRPRRAARAIFWTGVVAMAFDLTLRKVILWIYG